MVGGESSLGLGGYIGTPVERALPVVLTPPQKRGKADGRDAGDRPNRAACAREQRLLFALAGVRGVARNLKDSDLFGVIGFDKDPFPVIPLSYMGKIRHEVEAQIDRLRAAGGTYLLPALEEAKRQLERQHATRKHVVILTDGENRRQRQRVSRPGIGHAPGTRHDHLDNRGRTPAQPAPAVASGRLWRRGVPPYHRSLQPARAVHRRA